MCSFADFADRLQYLSIEADSSQVPEIELRRWPHLRYLSSDSYKVQTHQDH
jgi:hypothetical protein